MKNSTVRFRLSIMALMVIAATSCRDDSKEDDEKETGKKFEVKGQIINNPSAKMIYLERVPATMQRVIVDSSEIGKDGKYSLSTKELESSVFNLRIDHNEYPLTSVINDTARITVNATFNSANTQFAESYEVKGSIASQQMKDYMMELNGDLQKIFLISRRADSLIAVHPDSAMKLAEERAIIAQRTSDFLRSSLRQSSDPALSMFMLSYYQSTANNPGFRIQPLLIGEVSQIINDAAARFPGHAGVSGIKNSIDAQLVKAQGLIGKPAPEFALPDVNGKMVKLSSFKGKYVLVDFWASWCKPCRIENPNIVKAYKQFNNKNFTILGVSLDRPGQKDEWVNAIRQDNLTWTHVSDLKYWESEIVPLYGIDGIPFNVLVDPNGTVIAQGLTGPSLEAKLAEVLK